MPDLCVGVIDNINFYCDVEIFDLIVFVLRSILCFWYCFHLSAL